VNLTHWYHIWAAGEWREPVTEHWQALQDAEWTESVRVGIVGPPEARGEVVAWLSEQPLAFEVVAEADQGFEMLTLRAVHEYAKSNDGAVMYAHTKGAYDTSEFRKRWRRTMCHDVIGNWQGNLHVLEKGHDAIGPFWLTAEMFPNQIIIPIFGGNYWIATCEYLRTLPECEDGDRYNAEGWIGLGKPDAVDLRPGWPAEERFI
jgi:hypothetical protein